MFERRIVAPPVPFAPPQLDTVRINSVVGQSFAEFREAVAARVERASQTAEDGVIVAGKCIDVIFREAKVAASVTKSAQRMGPEIGELATQQSEHVQAFVFELGEVLDRQADATRLAMKQSVNISEAGSRISDIATSVSVLGLNAQIEATRLGAAGAGFNVIAAEMHELGKQVALANAMIGELATNLAAALPELLRNGERMKDRSCEFTTILARDIGLMEEANRRSQDCLRAAQSETERRLERIRQASNEALSALQFHDPMVQHLRQLPPLIDEMARRTELAVNSVGGCGYFPPLEDSIYQQVYATQAETAETGLVLEF